MSSHPTQIPIPPSYKDLPFKEIRLSHIPEDSPSATPIILITLYRPNKYNAFTDTMMTELVEAFTLIDVDPRVKCAIVTGHGKIFCAGADLETAFQGGEEAVREHRDGGGKVALAVQRCRKPVIGALQGSAVGIGITMTLPMSIRIAWEGAKIGFVFARRGLVMEACSSYFLPRLIGMSKALHLTTTGSTYPASHPLLNSLFSETLSSPDQVLPRAIEIANEIVQNTSPISTYLMREMMYRDAGSPEGQHLLDSRIIYEMFSSKDNKEGVKAFLEKRPVKFGGTMQHDAPGAYPWWELVDTTNRPVPEGYQFKSKSRL